MKKAVAVPYVIAFILGVVVIALIGYWFVAQGGKTVGTGQSAECNALIFNRCNGFTEWTVDASKTCNGASDPKDTAKCGISSTPNPSNKQKFGACRTGESNQCGDNQFQDCINGFWNTCHLE